MTAEKDPKKAAAKCFEGIELDSESYRIGHTKVRFLHIVCILFCIAVIRDFFVQHIQGILPCWCIGSNGRIP